MHSLVWVAEDLTMVTLLGEEWASLKQPDLGPGLYVCKSGVYRTLSKSEVALVRAQDHAALKESWARKEHEAKLRSRALSADPTCW